MTRLIPIIVPAWGALCTVWAVLLWIQRCSRRAGLLLKPHALGGPIPGTPEVCAIIAARNEAATIECCIRHVLAQDYPHLRVVVVDDRSEDGTGQRVEQVASGDARVRVVRIESLPVGWLGKSHALWQGTRDVRTEWLLFLDADAILEPSAVRTAVAEATGRGADLLTLWPRNAAVGFWEHLLIPLCGGIIALWFGSSRENGSSRPFANGQFILVRRDVYERAGGHRAVRDALIEDVPLAERCEAAGAKLVAAGGADLFGVRMYDGLRSICDGWTRIFAGALRRPLLIFVSIAWLLFGSLLPYIAAPFIAWQALHIPSAQTFILLGLCVQHLLLIHVVSYRFWRMGRCNAWYLWLYPVSVGMVAGILARAALTLCVSRRVVWRGVRYRIDGRARIVVDSDQDPRATAKFGLAWILWIAMAAVAALGLRHHRVDNSLDAWMPELRSVGPHPSYAVIGWETSRHQHDEITAALRGAPGVASIIDQPAVRAMGWAVGLTPVDFVVAADGSYEGLFCFRDAKLSDAQFIDGIRSSLGRFDGVAIGGPAAYAAALDEVSQRRMDVIMALIACLGFALLIGLTGDLRASAAGVAAITLSQVILVGAIGWLRIPMGMALMMVPPLMMALGLSYVAHRALRRTFTWRGGGGIGVLALCALTTALGMASFATAPLPPIRSFALAGVAGLALVWSAAVTLVPPANVRGRRRRRLPGLDMFLRLQHRPFIVRATAAAALMATALMAPELRFASDPLNFFPPDARVVGDFRTLDERLTGMLPFQVRTTMGHAAERIAASPGVRKVIDITPLVSISSPRERTFWCLADNDSLPHLAASAASWKSRASAEGAAFAWLGVAAQIHGTEQIVKHVAIGGLPLMVATVFVTVVVISRRARFAFAAAVVSLLPVAALIIVAAALKIPLGIPSLMIGSITVGIAVDDVLHLGCAARDRRSVRRAMVACWNPCVGSSMIDVVCLCCFLLSQFGPTRQFGVLMATSTFFAMVANQLVFPTLMAGGLVGERDQRIRQPVLTGPMSPIYAADNG